MKNNIVKLSKREEQILEKALKKRVIAERKFPLLFGLLATFGLASVLYSFQRIIDGIDLFVNHPWILFIIGISVLLATGAAYRKLN